MSNKLWRMTGQVAFWVSWPLLYLYLRRGRRTRVLIVSGDHIVVLHNWLGGGKWSLPGGGLHRREKSVDGAVREVREETGLILTSADLQFLGSAKSKKHGLTIEYDQFVANIPRCLALKPQRLEVLDVAWMPIAGLSKDNAEEVTLSVLTTGKP